jgi:acetoin utilization deacetylase AcuC-like enzyme
VKIVWNPALEGFDSAIISLRKPYEILRCVQRKTDTLIVAQPAARAQLLTAHSERYVDGVLCGDLKTGFGEATLELLRQIRAANGVMIAAAAEALDDPGAPIMAPVSGFHHAHYDHGYGFCTFNGLVMAARLALDRLPAGRDVLIIDGDGHYGDGTDDILGRIPAEYGTRIYNLTQFNRDDWRRRLTAALSDRPWGLVLYQAGADAHEKDPYGAGYLNDFDWEDRDRMVFEHCALSRTPIAWNLAGGYNGASTIALHIGTADSARRALALRDRSASAVLQPVEQVASEGRPAKDVLGEGGALQG